MSGAKAVPATIVSTQPVMSTRRGLVASDQYPAATIPAAMKTIAPSCTPRNVSRS